MNALIPERGSFAGKVYSINRTPYVLGRSPDCDLLDVFSGDPQVSRQHARLVGNDHTFLRCFSERRAGWQRLGADRAG